MFYARFMKPVADSAMALLFVGILSPLLLLLFLTGWLHFGNPLFVQKRAGMKQKPFSLFKFRSMLDYPHLTEQERITAYGRFIRRFSLDELPQLANILAGHMSFVGPRPLPVAYAGQMTDAQKRRFQVKPGLSGLAQVNGRNGLSWEQKFSFDVDYVEKKGLKTDLKVLLKTFPAWWTGEGISHPGYATMPVLGAKCPSP